MASSAKAIGMPSAMAPSSAPRKMATVMACHPVLARSGGGVFARQFGLQRLELGGFLRLLDHHQVGFAELAGQQRARVRAGSARRPNTAKTTPTP